MEDISLDELTTQLQAAQEKKSTVRLSERNVVELVSKLKELGIIDNSLLHSANGKEYITIEHLKKEILQQLDAHGGRLSLAEMASILNVDIAHCERQSQVIVENSSGQLSLAQGDLISQQYLISAAQEINERLATVGMLRIGDLAIQYELKSDLVLSFLSTQLGETVFGHLIHNILYTKEYVDRVKAQLRGALRGLTAPSLVSPLVKKIQLEETGSTDIVNKILQDLQKEGDVKGELKTTGQWIPAVYVDNQKASAVSFFNQNGWIAISVVKKLAGSSLEEAFVGQNFQNAEKLNSVYVSQSLIATVDAELREYLESEKWFDVNLHVPADFNVQDLDLLLKFCQASVGQHSYISETGICVLSQSFMEGCKSKVHEFAVQSAKEPVSSTPKDTKPTPAKTEQTEEELDKPRSKKKGKSKKQNKASQKTGASMNPALTKEALQQHLLSSLEGVEEIDSLAEHLVESLHTYACTIYQQTMDEMARRTNDRREKLKDASLKSLEEGMVRFWLFSRGIDQLESELDEQTVVLLRKHLIKNTGSEVVDWMLRYFQLQEPGADEGIPEKLVPILPSDQTKLVAQLQSDILPLAQEALLTLKKDQPESILESLEAGLRACGIRFPKRDKKLEKARIIEFKDKLHEQLISEEEPSTVLSIVLPLLLAKVKGVALTVPGRSMPTILSILKTTVENEHFQILEAFHKAVVQQLSEKSNAGRNPDIEADSTLSSLVDEIHEKEESPLYQLMSKVKTLA